jgi:hypothetical protein
MRTARRLAPCILAAALLASACGGDDDDSGGDAGPARDGTSLDWGHAWQDQADAACDQCVTIIGGSDDDPASDAQGSDYKVLYVPDADPDGNGWQVVQDFGAAAGCDVPSEPPSEMTTYCS